MDLVLFTLLLELLDLNLNVKKGHTEFWGKPPLPYSIVYVTVVKLKSVHEQSNNIYRVKNVKTSFKIKRKIKQKF